MNIANVGMLHPNTLGRDLIIGDLHGHYDTLRHLLCENRFDKKIDRVISVGDVIDRGPRSWDCLQLFREPWFHGVKGNHELALLGMALTPTGQRSLVTGKRITEARKRMGLTQADLAEKIGMSTGLISQYELEMANG